MSRNASAILMPTTSAMASECRVSELKKASPDSRSQVLNAVSSSRASALSKAAAADPTATEWQSCE